MNNRIVIFDTTLRDGEQSPGAALSVTEKVEIARQLEKLNVDVIDVNYVWSKCCPLKILQYFVFIIYRLCLTFLMISVGNGYHFLCLLKG